jgi:homoserine/homoserine lactone efflux protein
VNTELFWNYVVVTTLFCLSPGPAVLFVLGQALWRGPRAGFAAILGIQIVNLLWMGVAALGLSAILALSPTAFQLLKWVGAAYLVYLGARAIWFSFREGEVVWKSSNRAFFDSMVVQISNPKSVLYITAIVPQFIDKTHPVLPQIGIITVTGALLDTVTMSAYVLLAGAFRHRLAQLPRMRAWLDRVSGIVLIGIGAVTALYHR